MNYIKSVEVISGVNPLKSGVRVEFSKPITIIVGDNGVGKSTLLECIRDHFGYVDDTYMRRKDMKKNIKLDMVEDKFNFNYIDFHGDDKKFSGSFGSNIGLQIAQMRASSGQVSMSLVSNLLRDLGKVKDGVIILDEPCRGVSISGQYSLAKAIIGLKNKFNCQVILTTHSSILLELLEDSAQYYNIEKNCDTSYKEYMVEMLSKI